LKVLVLHGSPRKGGDTDTLAGSFLEGLTLASQHDITHVYTNEIDVSPCQMCEKCGKPPYRCVIDDDMQPIYDDFISANLVVWASPMIWGYLTAQMKAVLDRMEALAIVPERSFEGKTYVAILGYRHHYQSAAAFFERICKYYGIRLHFLVYCSVNPKGGRDLPAADSHEKLAEAFELGAQLGKEDGVQAK